MRVCIFFTPDEDIQKDPNERKYTASAFEGVDRSKHLYKNSASNDYLHSREMLLVCEAGTGRTQSERLDSYDSRFESVSSDWSSDKWGKRRWTRSTSQKNLWGGLLGTEQVQLQYISVFSSKGPHCWPLQVCPPCPWTVWYLSITFRGCSKLSRSEV